MDHMFKPRPPDHAVLGSLLNGTPKDMEFQKGATAALKIQSTLAGYPDFQNDPDVLAARDAVKRIGGSPDFIAPRADENSNVAAELLRALLYQHVIDHHKTK